jgi:hypothetical protein
MTSTNPTANLPPVRVEPDARRRIRHALAEAGRRIAVLDDDPTGSQTVHDGLGLQAWRIACADPGLRHTMELMSNGQADFTSASAKVTGRVAWLRAR